MGKKFVLAFLGSLVVTFLPGAAMGQHGHDHGSSSPAAPQKGTSHEMTMGNQPTHSVSVEGLKITFEVMDMSMHMSMPGMKGNPQHGASEHSQSHALMVKVQDTASKEIISDAKSAVYLNSTFRGERNGQIGVVRRPLWRGFSPKEKGAYQFQLMIESGGMEREAKFTYEFK